MNKGKLLTLVLVSIMSTHTWAQQPAALPSGIDLSGTYYCNKSLDKTQPKKLTELQIVYNKNNGEISGRIKSNKTHFSYIMTSNNIARSKRGVFFWAPDKKNSVDCPMLNEPIYLLKDGSLASATVHKIKGGADYEVPKKEILDIIVFTKNIQKTNNINFETVAKEIGDIATSAWGDFLGDDNSIVF